MIFLHADSQLLCFCWLLISDFAHFCIFDLTLGESKGLENCFKLQKIYNRFCGIQEILITDHLQGSLAPGPSDHPRVGVDLDVSVAYSSTIPAQISSHSFAINFLCAL